MVGELFLTKFTTPRTPAANQSSRNNKLQLDSCCYNLFLNCDENKGKKKIIDFASKTHTQYHHNLLFKNGQKQLQAKYLQLIRNILMRIFHHFFKREEKI